VADKLLPDAHSKIAPPLPAFKTYKINVQKLFYSAAFCGTVREML
jgi:hypothetical protein